MPKFSEQPQSEVRQRLLDGMIRYMKLAGNDCGYKKADVAQCMKIIDGYLAALGEGKSSKLSEPKIREAVKKAVLDLNRLNEKCGGSLIETDQREYLCQLLLVAARRAGLKTRDDITEAWREW